MQQNKQKQNALLIYDLKLDLLMKEWRAFDVFVLFFHVAWFARFQMIIWTHKAFEARFLDWAYFNKKIVQGPRKLTSYFDSPFQAYGPTNLLRNIWVGP